MYKGIVQHLTAKIIFISSSYLIHFFLGKFLTPENYGMVGVLITIINFGYLFLNNGVRQAISKEISQKQYNHIDIIKKGITIQFVIVLFAVTVLFFAAPFLSFIMGDKTLTTYIRVTVIIIPFMGIYFAMLGIFNGFQMFSVETKILIVYPILKLSIIPFVFWGNNPIFDTEQGFIFSAIIIAAICAGTLAVTLKRKKETVKKDTINWKTFIKSSLSFSSIFLTAAVIMNIDLLILKSLSNNTAFVGYYTGIMNFAKIPYYLITAIFQVILPIISNYYIQGKLDLARKSICHVFELILGLIMPIIIIITNSGNTLLEIFYNEAYTIADKPMGILLFGTFFLGITILLNMLISASGGRTFTLKLAILWGTMDLLLCVCLVQKYSMLGAAFSNFLSSGVCMIISLIVVVKRFGSVYSSNQFKLIMMNIVIAFFVHYMNSVIKINNFIQLMLFYGIIYILVIVIEFNLKLFSVGMIKNDKNNQ